jgi:5'-3' exonuclease
MILIDNTQIILGTIFAQYDSPMDVTLELARHVTLATYRMYRNMFYAEYGELVLCQDAGNYWRRDIFPNYKINRKKTRAVDDYNWDRIFEILDTIRTEVQENFPYKSVKVERCEADDIIATLVKHYHDKEKIMIVSSDKDFQQLFRYPNVKQYSPIKKSLVTCAEPDRYLFEHIIKGDATDGIPNILSADDTFAVDGKRQKPLAAKKLAQWKTFSDVPQEYQTNINRNQMLVDHTYIPMEYENNILEKFNEPPEGDRSKLFDYFVEKRLKNLMDVIQDF